VAAPERGNSQAPDTKWRSYLGEAWRFTHHRTGHCGFLKRSSGRCRFRCSGTSFPTTGSCADARICCWSPHKRIIGR